MNNKEIEALAEIVQKFGLTKLEVDGGHVLMERACAPAVPPQQGPAVPEQLHAAEPIHAVEEREGNVVRSPAVGVFYAASSPNGKPFVRVGDAVHVGDTLCIIEAMKLMNEITSEFDGKIVEICVGNGQVVEYDQPLFRIL